MTHSVIKILEKYLSKYGWSFKKVSEKTIISGWQGQHRCFPLVISYCDTWISFEVNPLLKLEIDWEFWPELTAFALNLNASSRMIRLSMTEEGTLSLLLDIFSANLNFQDFSDALGVLGYYADYFYEEMTNKLDRVGFPDIDSLPSSLATN